MIFFYTFSQICHFLVLFAGFSPNLDIFGKKRGGTPNPQVKKVGVTPNSDQIFASAAARRGSGRPRF